MAVREDPAGRRPAMTGVAAVRGLGRGGRTAAGVWGLTLLLAGGCRNQATAPAVATPHEVRYQLDWVLDGVERTADGSAWETTNDLGYRVRVTRGYVSSYSMELVECPRDAGTPIARLCAPSPVAINSFGVGAGVSPAAPPFGGAQTRSARLAAGTAAATSEWVRPVPRITAQSPLACLGAALWSAVEATAYAGHSVGTPNPAAIRAMQVESLLAPAPRAAGAVTLLPQAYCQLHYLVARADRDAHGLPIDLDMVDTSLHIEGTYRAPGGSTDVPFVVHTAAAYGTLLDRAVGASEPMHVDTGVSAVDVTVRRHLGKIFDGVDFVLMRPPVIAGQVLRSLIDHVEVAIRPAHGDA
jgi:hypothetical protein